MENGYIMILPTEPFQCTRPRRPGSQERDENSDSPDLKQISARMTRTMTGVFQKLKVQEEKKNVVNIIIKLFRMT